MGCKSNILEALKEGTIVNSANNSYRILTSLGQGGFGITYKVERQSDRHVLAMKEYFPSGLCERSPSDSRISYLKSNSSEIRAGIDRFVTEARRLVKNKISHPNLVAIQEVFQANDTAYYTMEFIDGDNLHQYVRKSGNVPLSVPQMLDVMRPILLAVDLIHRNRLTHLDIKHDNIVLTQEADGSLRPVLIDFGLAKHYDKRGNATSKFDLVGASEGFAPPEQYLGLTKFTPQADVYALSATMLYLLTAREPDKEMSESEISKKLDLTEPSHSRIGDGIRTAIINGLRKDKTYRIQSVTELASALGIELSTQNHEGSVTRLLTINKKERFSFPKFNLRKIIDTFTKEKEPTQQNSEILYHKGCDCLNHKNYAKGLEYLKRAAAGDNDCAMFKLGQIYYRGTIDGTPDHKEAARWFHEAASRGNIPSQLQLGHMYRKGLVDGTNDYFKAAEWYARASEHGDPNAQFYLALLYENKHIDGTNN